MLRLFIAEKPSLGRAIASGLAKPQKNYQGYIECGNGDVVTWCVGHLLEQVEPDAYDKKYKSWRMDDLPMIPNEWQLKPRKTSSKQLAVVRKLVKSATKIVHAGDPDREGQLLVDEVLNYLKVPKTKQETTQRLLINDLNLPAVKRALANMRSNKEFASLSISALARSRADWLYGMNMTRAYTLLGQKEGYKGVLSVGRVQTPVLGLVVRRDEEIANFISKNYYTLDALIPYQNSNFNQNKLFIIKARWKPSDACLPWQDEKGRILNHKLVQNVAKRIIKQPATVINSESQEKKQNAPLPYSLSSLQIDAAKRYGFSAKQVLDTCQVLYEKYKLITYPRSDSRYLPKGHYAQREKVCNAIGLNNRDLSYFVDNSDLTLKSRAWNDAKVDAHHAIIPTPKLIGSLVLSGNEEKIYYLIARQYLMQFYPVAVDTEVTLEFDILGGVFIAKGRHVLSSGWRLLLKQIDAIQKPEEKKQYQQQNESSSGDSLLPLLSVGDEYICENVEIQKRMTEPPRCFTEASILQAMTSIAHFVEDKELKKILRDTDGLGTEATRAGILETLFKRQLLKRNGKMIYASEAGKGLISALPKEVSYPDMTAHWEYQLQSMVEKKQSYKPFIDALELKVTNFIIEAQQKGKIKSF